MGCRSSVGCSAMAGAGAVLECVAHKDIPLGIMLQVPGLLHVSCDR